MLQISFSPQEASLPAHPWKEGMRKSADGLWRISWQIFSAGKLKRQGICIPSAHMPLFLVIQERKHGERV